MMIDRVPGRATARVAFSSVVGVGLMIGCRAAAPLHEADGRIETVFGAFERETILLGGSEEAADFTEPAYVRFGPDGRLYVSTYAGELYALTLAEDEGIESVETFAPFGDRLLTGMAFDPWASPAEPVLYVVNNDPPIYGAADFTGRVSRLSGVGFGVVEDLIVGLPRSFENHMTFDLEFGLDRRLYVSQGGNTNNGAAASGVFGDRPERPLSAAVLVAAVRDPAFAGIEDVVVHAPGFRNGYGMTLHSNGRLYVVDQGANKGLGGRPDPDGEGEIDVPENLPDELNVVVPGRYYGHPNPARGELAFAENLPDGTPYQPPVVTFPLYSVVTGIAEYSGVAMGDVPAGVLLLAGFYDGNLHYVVPSAEGTTAVEQGVLAGGFDNPLDIAVGPDGAIYVLEAGGSLAFGGDGPSRITVLEPLFSTKGAWQPGSALPTHVADHVAATVGDRIYALAGETLTGDAHDALLVRDPPSGEWSSRPAGLPGESPRDAALAVVGERFYLLGGFVGTPSAASDAVYAYDTVAGEGSTLAPLPRARGGAAAAADGKIYLFGGSDGETALADVAVYDPAADEWTDLSAALPMPTPRQEHAAVVGPNGLIYCIGGEDAAGAPLAVVEAFDPVETRWITGYTDLPAPRTSLAAERLGTQIVVIGGRTPAGAASDDVFAYDPVSNTWRMLAELPAGRTAAAVARLGNTLHLIGGSATGPTDDTFIFTP